MLIRGAPEYVLMGHWKPPDRPRAAQGVTSKYTPAGPASESCASSRQRPQIELSPLSLFKSPALRARSVTLTPRNGDSTQ